MKKFFKIFGYCMLGLLGVVVVALGFAWISGAFKKEKVPISEMTVLAENVVCENAPVLNVGEKSMEVVLNGDTTLTSTITHKPEKATEIDLTVKYIHGKDILEETPDKIESGTPFTLKFKKDESGLPIGGEVELKLINSTKLLSYTIKILVDRPLQSSDIVYSTEDFTDITSGTNIGKLVTPSNPNLVKKITLNTLNANAIAPKKGAVVFTDPEILEYKNKKMLYILTGDTKKLAKEEITDSSNVELIKNLNGTVDFDYSFRALSATKNVGIKSFVFKTFAMQKDFNEDWLYSIINKDIATFPLADFNNFINKHYTYIAYGEHEEFMNNNTVVDEETNQRVLVTKGDMIARLNGVIDAIFATAEQGIIISDIEIANIACKELITYNVFFDKTFNSETVGDSDTNFDYLGVVLNSSTQNEEDNLLLKDSIGNLVIAPYVKYQISGDEKVPEKDHPWQYAPSEVEGSLGDPIIESGPKVIGFDGKEYLKYVKVDDSWYKFNEDYVRVIKNEGENGAVTWQIKTLLPTSNLSTDPTLHLVYSIESINSDGNASFKYAQSKIKINYSTPTNFKWTDYSDAKLLLHNDTAISTDKILQANAYTINSVTLQKNQVISNTTLDELQYKTIRFYMIKDSNIFQYNGKEYEIFDMTGINVVKLATMAGEEFELDGFAGKKEFYDLGENPTLIAKNITSLNDEEFTSSVKIFAVILQNDAEGNLITIEKDGEELNKVVVSTPVKEYTVDYFAQSLYTYKANEDEGNYTSTNGNPVGVKAGNFTEVYVSVFPLDENLEVVDPDDGEGNDTDGICNALLNICALKNYFNLYNGISYTIDYGTGTYVPNDDRTASTFVRINSGEISYDMQTLPMYITIKINFNVIDENPVSDSGTTLATPENPIKLDFIVYLTPQQNINKHDEIPYYDLTANTITRLEIQKDTTVEENPDAGEEGGEEGGEGEGSGPVPTE